MYFMNASSGVPDKQNLLSSIRELQSLYKDSFRIYV